MIYNLVLRPAKLLLWAAQGAETGIVLLLLLREREVEKEREGEGAEQEQNQSEYCQQLLTPWVWVGAPGWVSAYVLGQNGKSRKGKSKTGCCRRGRTAGSAEMPRTCRMQACEAVGKGQVTHCVLLSYHLESIRLRQSFL